MSAGTRMFHSVILVRLSGEPDVDLLICYNTRLDPVTLFIFPGARHGRPLSNMAMLQLMRGMGYGVNGDRGDYVPHGFRSSFRDWSGEVSSFPRDVCEMALAHVIENKAEAAYRRGDLFAKRRKMMQEWADYVNKQQAEVIPLNKHA